MTTEEKLERFQRFCLEDARLRSNTMLDEYTQALEKTFSEHQEDARRRAGMQIKAESEKLKKEMNKRVAVEQINLKRTIGRKQEELKDMLFVELRDKLAHFTETPAYLRLLEKQILSATQLAGAEPLIIYLDPADEDKARRLSIHHNADIRISQYSFSGGTRAVIPGKNILIDNSFETKLKEAREQFQFQLNLEKGGVLHG